MTDRPVLEAVGEVLADMEGAADEFLFGRDAPDDPKAEGAYRRYYLATISQAEFIIDRLSALGYAISPTPIVNAGEER